MVRPMRRPWVLLACLGLAAASPGCGHPASEAECRTLVDRMVELELKAQGVTDPAVVAKRRTETVASDAGPSAVSDLYRGCLGRRVTDGMMTCIRNAAAADEITDSCLR